MTRRTLAALAAAWLACLVALVALLADPAPLIPAPQPVLIAPEGELTPTTRTREISVVLPDGTTTTKTIDCEDATC